MEGQNPLVVRAMTQQDAENFAVRDSDVEGNYYNAAIQNSLKNVEIFQGWLSDLNF